MNLTMVRYCGLEISPGETNGVAHSRTRNVL